MGGLAADPGVDLIENHGGDLVAPGAEGFEHQHDPRKLPPGGNGDQRLDRLTRVR